MRQDPSGLDVGLGVEAHLTNTDHAFEFTPDASTDTVFLLTFYERVN